MSITSVSIIGLGWLGLPLAQRLTAASFQVAGSVTTAEKREALSHESFAVEQLLLRPEPMGNLSALLQAEALVINVPPRAGKQGDDFHPAQIKHLTTAIRQTAIQHVIYVSSTSVYPELNRVVTENDVTTIDQSAAPGLSKAEQFIQQLAPERSVTVVRMGGLMGYDRIPGKYVAGKTVDTGAVPVNYIHRDDAIDILVNLIQRPNSGVFNAVAPKHPSREAIYRKSCADFGYTLPTFVEPERPIPYKVVSAEKMSQQLKYVFKYPNPLQFFYER